MEPIKKPFIVANVRDILDLYDKEEISFSKMVEMLNDVAEKFYAKDIEKNCRTCMHVFDNVGSEPCDSCRFFCNWEPYDR